MPGPVYHAGGFPRQALGDLVALRLDTLALEVWNGAAWLPMGGGGGGQLLAFTILAGTGTHNLNPATTRLRVYVRGGGGAGGGTAPGAPGGGAAGGGGGAGGKVVNEYVAGLAAAYDYVVGAGGPLVPGGAGGAGAASTWAPTGGPPDLTAGGGGGGGFQAGAAGSAWVAGGAGGVSLFFVGAEVVDGDPGDVGGHPSAATGFSGKGGSCEDGSPGQALVATGPGLPATGFGAGGGGALALATALVQAGGGGAPGTIMVWEYA